jgi:hypothetical protein
MPQEGRKQKGVKSKLAQYSRRWDRPILAQDGRRWEGSKRYGLGWRGPALWASGVSELRHWGGGRSYYLDACGRLERRDERTQVALRCISRSLVSAPAVHHRVSRWRRPAAGWSGHIAVLCSRIDVREKLGDCQSLGTSMRGGQNYSGANLRRR